jgi:hypothetical protein
MGCGVGDPRTAPSWGAESETHAQQRLGARLNTHPPHQHFSVLMHFTSAQWDRHPEADSRPRIVNCWQQKRVGAHVLAETRHVNETGRSRGVSHQNNANRHFPRRHFLPDPTRYAPLQLGYRPQVTSPLSIYAQPAHTHSRKSRQDHHVVGARIALSLPPGANFVTRSGRALRFAHPNLNAARAQSLWG